MNYVDVFTGISAPTVAWSPLGWKALLYAEVGKFPSQVLAHHYPKVRNVGDMTKITEADCGAVDILVGGSPCQDFSVAGLRAGMDGKRGQLTVEFAHLAGRLRPRWLVWENVPGVLSIDEGRAFGAFIGHLGKLGYGIAYRVLDAQYAGVPQRRRRVFVVGYLGDWRRAAAVLFERHSLSGHPPPSREKGQSTTHDLAPSLTNSGRGVQRAGDKRGQDPVVAVARSVAIRGRDGVPQVELGDEIANAILTPNGGRGGIGVGAVLAETPAAGCWWDGGQVSQTLDAVLSKGQMMPEKNRFPAVLVPATAHSLRADGFDASEDGTGRGTPLGPVAIQAGCVGGAMPELDDVASLRAASGGSSRSYIAGMAVRRLTPRECERLQGFPDDYTRISDKTADGPRYKALGNSMAVPVMRWIGERIQQVEAL